MRIIGGEFKRRRLMMPAASRIRPTQDRVREAIFNVIREAVPGSVVLDLFAGSGAFGIEALSRGAHLSIFVDNNNNCIKCIKKNLALLGDRIECSQLYRQEAVRAISDFHKKGRKFDIIFLDPPYYKDLAKNSLIKIGACDILSKHGFVIAEHFVKDDMPENVGDILRFKKNRYGDTVISFYRRV